VRSGRRVRRARPRQLLLRRPRLPPTPGPRNVTSSSARTRRRSFVRLLRRFRSNDRAATAVEFGMIAALFIGVLLCTLEVGLYMFAQNVLQAAAVQAGRLYLTGQAQTSNMTQAQLITTICPTVQSFFNCNGIMVDLQSYSSFSGTDTSKPSITFDGSGNVSNSWSYTPGAAGQVVVLRIMYQWPVIVAPYALITPTLSNGKTLIMGITAFRVEPY